MECARRTVDPEHLLEVTLLRQAQCDAARASTHIDDLATLDTLQQKIHQALCLGPRNQRPIVTDQRQLAKSAEATNMSQRLSYATPADSPLELTCERTVHRSTRT